jgi:Anti-sigma-K factor rskA/Putative zinc-finger
MTGHEHWDEQAAAYALDALDDEERDDFESHVDGCSRCREQVDQHALVAAQLGALAGDDTAAAPPPWSAIRDAVVGDTSRDPTGNVVSLRPRSAWLAAAAAVVVLIAGATAYRATRSGDTAQPLASVSACRNADGCHVVPLRAGDSSPATVLVDGSDVVLLSTSMPAPPPGHIWALWQVPRRGAPRLLAEFSSGDSRSRLQTSYGDTAAFAVSKETSGVTPTAPASIVATGNI